MGGEGFDDGVLRERERKRGVLGWDIERRDWVGCLPRGERVYIVRVGRGWWVSIFRLGWYVCLGFGISCMRGSILRICSNFDCCLCATKGVCFICLFVR